MQFSRYSISQKFGFSLDACPVVNGEGEVVLTQRSRNCDLQSPRHFSPTFPLKTAALSRTTPGSKRSQEGPTLATAAIRRSPPTDWATTHQSNLQRRLERRLQIAMASGDRNLINLLEQEMQQLV
ncbi:hypothetical protein BST81_21810 [Leptolyngbya sp. 'hensonii']|uniref:arginine synthesis PII-interacting regulator PirA n=1 Tax=Leptolyngbya sp. 'hensonii' TaxID=1922337 RepID=UPI000950148B|nr:hypothetical protein [Leptolyngbya sp. 'hensonii']OLP16241.1 hypothetical protein BST81_21810 [Leptolyngbya sp. 'hensonii']